VAHLSRLRRLERSPPASWLPEDAVIARHLVERDSWLRYREPRYQLQMIKDLAGLLPAGRCRVLDVGAGSGLIGETIAAFFPGKTVTGVDIAPSALPNLRIPLVRFDGSRIPFTDHSFDCALFCNVLHHVKPEVRARLLREALRVTGGGPLVIKDHLSATPLDGLRLWLLDVMGNAPRGAMISARYLGEPQWEALLHELKCTGEVLPVSAYRSGVANWCFPNRLEICLRIDCQSA
jgi:SAM-dependent methyltransferase